MSVRAISGQQHLLGRQGPLAGRQQLQAFKSIGSRIMRATILSFKLVKASRRNPSKLPHFRDKFTRVCNGISNDIDGFERNMRTDIPEVIRALSVFRQTMDKISRRL